MRQIFAVVCLLVIFSTAQSLAQDKVEFMTTGNVLVMEIYRSASTGVYEFTRLVLAVDPSNSSLFPTPNNYFIVNCDADDGGDEESCEFTSAFFGSQNCLPLQHTSFSSFFMGHPISKNVTMDRYVCEQGAPRDAGECVTLGGEILHVFTQDNHNQVLWPWVREIDFQASCTNK